jgi:hypothetical protein
MCNQHWFRDAFANREKWFHPDAVLFRPLVVDETKPVSSARRRADPAIGSIEGRK